MTRCLKQYLQFPARERPLSLCIRVACIRVSMQFVSGVYVILYVKYFQMLNRSLFLCFTLSWFCTGIVFCLYDF
jgi:hypothetical protein